MKKDPKNYNYSIRIHNSNLIPKPECSRKNERWLSTKIRQQSRKRSPDTESSRALPQSGKLVGALMEKLAKRPPKDANKRAASLRRDEYARTKRQKSGPENGPTDLLGSKPRLQTRIYYRTPLGGGPRGRGKGECTDLVPALVFQRRGDNVTSRVYMQYAGTIEANFCFFHFQISVYIPPFHLELLFGKNCTFINCGLV